MIRSTCAIACVLVAALALPGCASRKKAPEPDPSAKGMTQAAAADYYYLLYQELSRQGQAKQAILVLEKLIELAPGPDLYRDLANLSWSLGDPAKTREVLEEGLKKYPDEKVLHFYLANSYLLERRYDEAVKVLKDYLAKHPKDQSASQELGAVLVESGKHQEALDFLSALPRDRRTPAMAYYESKAYWNLKRPKQALEKLRQALREDPNMLAAWSELAFIHEKQGDYRQAEEAYRRIMDLGEEGPEIWMRLIRLALKQKNEAKALELLDKAPKDRNTLFEVMGLFIDEGFQDGAARALERIAREQPANADVIFIRAMLAIEKEKDAEKAFELLDQIPKNHKLYDKSLTTRVQLAIDNSQFDRALPLIAEGKAAYPDRMEFWFLEGILYDKKGDLTKAAEIYKAAVTNWPGNTDALYRHGVVLERMKMRAEAMAAMEQILAIEPGNPDALNFVGYSLAEDGRDLDRAQDMITRALAANPESPYFIDSLAWVYFKRGDLKNAWIQIQRAASKPSEDPTIWEHYGDIAKAMGNKKEAEKGYRRALEKNPPNAAEVQEKLSGLK
jgi:tetratricopeptide (TPR) repeat protein